jgi:alpha 1,3-glucosidase
MVVIVDPHLKRAQDYPAFKQASELGILVKPKSGEGEYEGWCWPGSSSWTDFFNPAAWAWWKSVFKIEEIPGKWSWTKSTTDIHIWNDMNEVWSSYVFLSRKALLNLWNLALGVQRT